MQLLRLCLVNTFTQLPEVTREDPRDTPMTWSPAQKLVEILALKGMDTNYLRAIIGGVPLSFWSPYIVQQSGVDSEELSQLKKSALRNCRETFGSFERWEVEPVPGVLTSFWLEVKREVRDFVDRIDELVRVCGLAPLSLEERQLEELKIFILSFFGRKTVSTYKLLTNLTFSTFFGLEKPANPLGLTLGFWPNRLRAWLCRERSSIRRRTSSMERLNTIFQGWKKGLLPVSPDGWFASLQKHAANLGRRRSLSPVDLAGIKDLLRRKHAPLGVPKLSFLEQEKFLSSSATESFNFGNHGNVGALADVTQQYLGGGDSRFLVGDQLLGMAWHPVKGVIEMRVPVWEPLRGLVLPLSEELNKGQPRVVANAILEPFKARIITKPRVFEYASLQATQKRLHRAVRGLWGGYTFDLIGTPLAARHLIPILAGIDHEEDTLVVSGDYSAATDGMSYDLSKNLIKHVFGNFPSREYEKIFATMSQNLISYPDSHPFWGSTFSYPTITPVEQKNGQVMGNPISFPILCLGNYVVFHYLYEEWSGKTFAGGQLPISVLINGDDILFRAPTPFVRHWRRRVSDFGFEPSLGKNFESREYLQINSELWAVFKGNGLLDKELEKADLELIALDRDHRQEQRVATFGRPWRKVGYVNFGLATSRSKADCSRDLSLERVGLRSRDTREEDKGFEDWQLRLRNSCRIFHKYTNGLSTSTLKAAIGLWTKHWSYYRNRLPGLPFPGFSAWNETLTLLYEGVMKRLFRKENPYSIESELGLTYFGVLSSTEYDPYRLWASLNRRDWRKLVFADVYRNLTEDPIGLERLIGVPSPLKADPVSWIDFDFEEIVDRWTVRHELKTFNDKYPGSPFDLDGREGGRLYLSRG